MFFVFFSFSENNKTRSYGFKVFPRYSAVIVYMHMELMT